MKAILLAAAATLLTLVFTTLVFRAARIERRVLALLLVYVVVLGVLIAVSLGTPEDLWFLPGEFLAEPRWFDLLASIFFYSAAFFGGVLQLYNLADRGLSLRILIDVLERGERTPAASDLFEGYSGGRGMGWMYAKRIEGLIKSQLVVIDGDMLVLTQRGENTAKIYAGLRRLLRTGVE